MKANSISLLYKVSMLRLSEADEIEKELDGALVRADRLRAAVFPQHCVCGMIKSAFEGRLV